jgi:hypothetical protein
MPMAMSPGSPPPHELEKSAAASCRRPSTEHRASSRPRRCVILLWFMRRKYRWYSISTCGFLKRWDLHRGCSRRRMYHQVAAALPLGRDGLSSMDSTSVASGRLLASTPPSRGSPETPSSSSLMLVPRDTPTWWHRNSVFTVEGTASLPNYLHTIHFLHYLRTWSESPKW